MVTVVVVLFYFMLILERHFNSNSTIASKVDLKEMCIFLSLPAVTSEDSENILYLLFLTQMAAFWLLIFGVDIYFSFYR